MTGITSSAISQTLTGFSIPQAFALPSSITAGADGALWFTDQQTNKIGRITTAGVVTLFPIPGAASSPRAIVLGSDGALWFARSGSAGGHAVGRFDPTTLAFNEFPIPSGSLASAMTAGPDGNLWFTIAVDFVPLVGRVAVPSGAITIFNYPNQNAPRIAIGAGIVAESSSTLLFTGWEPSNAQDGRIGRVTLTGEPSLVATEIAGGDVRNLVAGPDGAFWFTSNGGNGNGDVGRVTSAGVVTIYPIPGGFRTPVQGFTSGPDGALWLISVDDPRIRRVEINGTVTTFPPPASGFGGMGAITTGPDGNIWFAAVDAVADAWKIWRLIPPPSASPLLAAVLPSSRSVQVGGNVATAFATILNSGTSPIEGCGISPLTTVPATFLFQKTDPATNTLLGTPNARVSIPAGGFQTFLMAFTPNAAYVSLNVRIGYACTGMTAGDAKAVSTILGVNTLLLTSDADPVADMIAVGLTPSNDGYSHVPNVGGTGIFVIASTNIGAATSLTARARFLDASTQATATVCETNSSGPQVGQCKAPPSSTVSRIINQSENTTWTAFITSTGVIPQDPAKHRVVFEFDDTSNVSKVRGSTSTAVTTQ